MGQTFQYLNAGNLEVQADEAVRQACLRMHEIPAKDLPGVAVTLLELAERLKPKRAGKTVNPEKEGD
jgi:hypothetical protein